MHLQTLVSEPDPASFGFGMITGAQIRAGRGLLGWSAAQLAEKSGVSYSTVARAEAVDDVPAMRTPNLLAMQKALEAGGVIFFDAWESHSGAPGARLRLTLRRPSS